MPQYFFPIFPGILQIEPTNACNLKCLMCPRQTSKYPIGYMGLDLFKKIIDECSTVDSLIGQRVTIKLFFLGEPLLHPQYEEMLKYAHGKVGISVVTNGTLLKGGITRALLTYAGAVNVSMDGFYEDYNEVREGSKFNDVAENVRTLCRLKKEMGSGTHISIVTIIPDSDQDASAYLAELLWFWKDYDLIISPLHRQRHEGTFWLGKQPSYPQLVERTIPCRDGLSSLVIRWDGAITHCCGDVNGKVKLGDANADSLLDTWASAALNEIRSNILALKYGSLSLCRDCTVEPITKPRNLILPLIFKDKICPVS